MSSYYETKFGGLNMLRVETLFSQAAQSGFGGQRLYESLKNQGLGYRKTVMLEDYGRYQASFRATTPEGKQRAEDWYDKVFRPLQREMGGVQAKAVTKALAKMREGDITTEAEAEAAGDYADKYESTFG